MTIRGILFDKDGTLLDFNATWVPVNRAAALAAAGGEEALAAKLLEAGGQDESIGRVRSGTVLAVGNSRQIADLWGRVLADNGRDDLVGMIDDIFQRQGRQHAVPVPGLAAALTGLRARGLALGVATSDSHEGALQSLSPFGVVELFDFITGYDSGHGVKPEPGMVRAFCEASGLAPSEVCMVGDNAHDLEMGRAAGVGLVVGVLSGTSSADDLTLADHVMADISGLAALLDEVDRR